MDVRKSESLKFSDSVMELTPKHFSEEKSWALLPGKVPKLVYFYVPWCKFCQKSAPTINALGNWVKRNNIPILICSFNCELYKERTGAIKEDVSAMIDAYPSIVTFLSNGNPSEKYPREIKRELETLKVMCERIISE